MGDTPTDHKARTVLAGAIGNVLEWYDFALFAYFAPVIGERFFPSTNPIASLLDTFGVFALGFLMRPIGGILFGHIGDRIGRKKALEWSVLLMAVPTTCIGLLPTFAEIGILAPILLTLIRILQGISVGGEYIGSISFLGEHAPAGRRGYVASWAGFGGGFGNLMGSAVAALTTGLLAGPTLDSWGWRVPFLCGIFVGLVGLWLRLGIAESPRFEQAAESGDVAKAPFFEVFRDERRALAQTVGLSLMLSVGFYLPWVWLPTWLATINRPPLPEALTVNTIAMTVMVLMLPLGGWLSDRVGRKPVILAGCAGFVLFSYPLFLLLSRGTFAAALQAQLVFAVLAMLATGPASATYVELFPTRTRTTGIGCAYNCTQAVVGGTAPLLATWLIGATGVPLAPAFYLMLAAALGGFTALTIVDRYREPLR